MTRKRAISNISAIKGGSMEKDPLKQGKFTVKRYNDASKPCITEGCKGLIKPTFNANVGKCDTCGEQFSWSELPSQPSSHSWRTVARRWNGGPYYLFYQKHAELGQSQLWPMVFYIDSWRYLTLRQNPSDLSWSEENVIVCSKKRLPSFWLLSSFLSRRICLYRFGGQRNLKNFQWAIHFLWFPWPSIRNRVK